MAADKPDSIIRLRISQWMPFVLFGCFWVVACFFVLVMISVWDRNYERRLALVQSGSVLKETLFVAEITKDKGNNYHVGLSKTYPEPLKIEERQFTAAGEELHKGQPLDAYKIDEKYFVPRLSRSWNWWEKLFVVAFGVIPPLLMTTGIVLYYRRLAQKKARMERSGVRFLDSDGPENHVIGGDSYHNLPIAQVADDDRYFRIVPAELNIIGLILFALLTLSFSGLLFIATRINQPQDSIWFSIPFLLIGALTGGGFAAISTYTHRYEQRLGPWLVYDKQHREVRLPRLKMTFRLDEVVHLQAIATRRFEDRETIINVHRLSELNIVTCRNGIRQRWSLLRSTDQLKPFEDLLTPLVHSTPIPVVVVTEETLTGDITEIPFTRDERSES